MICLEVCTIYTKLSPLNNGGMKCWDNMFPSFVFYKFDVPFFHLNHLILYIHLHYSLPFIYYNLLEPAILLTSWSGCQISPFHAQRKSTFFCNSNRLISKAAILWNPLLAYFLSIVHGITLSIAVIVDLGFLQGKGRIIMFYKTIFLSKHIKHAVFSLIEVIFSQAVLF